MSALERMPAPHPVLPPVPANDVAPAARTLLRFITCGSVDDGKSTLIGRLLHDAGAVPDDQLQALERDSRRYGAADGGIDYSLLVDGLQAEREQGITIDVAYRYFSTPRRSFIVADTPGHEQYTRNMATGASTADLAVLLVDARAGLLPQTRRHAYIAALVGVRQVVLAVNKMDLVDYDEAVFHRIEADFRAAAASLHFEGVHAIPVSARAGDNVAARSLAMPWYEGPALLPLLEGIEPGRTAAAAGFAMPVQWVNRPHEAFRGYTGTVAAGSVRSGDAVTVLPSGLRTRVARIVAFDGDRPAALAGEATTLTVADPVDIARGDVLIAGNIPVAARRRLTARLLATSATALRPGAKLVFKLANATAAVEIVALHHAVEIETYAAHRAEDLPINAIGLATLRLDRPVAAAEYALCRDLGGFLLIDPDSAETVAFGFVEADPATAAATHADAARARPAWLRVVGEPGSLHRASLLRELSWRVSTGLAVGALAYAATGIAAAAVLAAVADPLLRALLRFGHDLAWKQGRRKIGGALEHGGGI